MKIFLNAAHLFIESLYFQNYGLFAYQMMNLSLCFILIFFFCLCVSINKEPSGVDLKCRQNKIDGSSLVLSVFYSYVDIKAFKMTVYPGRIIRCQPLLPIDAVW